MTMKSCLTHIMMCGMLAGSSFAAQSQSGAAPSFPRPAQADVVKAQGVYALSQLKALAAIYGADPSGAASREAMDNGWAPVSRSYASPQHGWPARGPSLGESIEPLLAQARAAKYACPGYEGACQAQSLAWAKVEAKRVRSAKNPGAQLAASVAQLE
jgi:hypothetical protein